MLSFRHLRPHTARALRRSRKLEELMLALHKFGPMTEVEAAREIRVTLERLRHILWGHPVEHRAEHSAVQLGIVVFERSRLGLVIELTELGQAEAQMVMEARASGRCL